MKEDEMLDQVCDPMTTDATKKRLRVILGVLAGLSASEARELVRLAGNAIDRLPIMPTLGS